MTDVAATSVQWTYRCRVPGCPNRIGPLRTACPEHVSNQELLHVIESPAFHVQQLLQSLLLFRLRARGLA